MTRHPDTPHEPASPPGGGLVGILPLMADLERGLKSLADSRPAYEEAEGYYKGTVEEFFSSERIKRALGGGNDRFRLTFSAIPVDARIDRIELASLTVPNNPTASAILTDKVINANDLDEDLEEFLRSAAYLGDYYLLVWEGESDDPDEEGNAAVTSVDVFGNSPLSMRVIYSRENSRRALYGIKVWQSDDGDRWRANLYYRDRTEQFISKAGAKNPTREQDFEPWYADPEDPESHIVPNEYGRIPIFHLRQGGKPYGVPVHLRAYGAQDAITKLNVTHMSTVDYQGAPQRYALMEADAGSDAEGDEWVEFETTGVQAASAAAGSIASHTKKSKLKSGPAEVWWLTGVKSVGQFTPAEPKVFMEPEVFMIRAMSRLTSTPLYEFELTGEQPSGEARRRADGPLEKSVAKMTRSYGPTIEDMAEFALEILGYPGLKVEAKWSPFDIATAKDDWETIGLKLEHGLPLRQALLEAGYTDVEIEEWYPKDGPALSPATLVRLGSALASFGQAVTLGSMTNDDVRAAIPALFVDDRAVEPEVEDGVVEVAKAEDPALTAARIMREKFETLGIAVRAGASQDSAAAALGLVGLEFTAVPTTVRVNASEADELEEK